MSKSVIDVGSDRATAVIQWMEYGGRYRLVAIFTSSYDALAFARDKPYEVCRASEWRRQTLPAIWSGRSAATHSPSKLVSWLGMVALGLVGSGRHGCTVSIDVPDKYWPVHIELYRGSGRAVSFAVGNGRTDSPAKAIEWAIGGVPD